MSFGKLNTPPDDGYHYTADYLAPGKRSLGPLRSIIGYFVLFQFGLVALTLSGHNPFSKMQYNAAMEEIANAPPHPALDETLLVDSIRAQYQTFSETIIGLRACEENYYERSKQNSYDKTHLQFRTALRDYQNKNMKAYREITEQLTLRAADGLRRRDLSAARNLKQDIGMLHRPGDRYPAKQAAYDKIAARGQDTNYCMSTLSKVRNWNLDIKI